MNKWGNFSFSPQIKLNPDQKRFNDSKKKEVCQPEDLGYRTGVTQDFAAAVTGCAGVVSVEPWKESGRFRAYSTSS